MKKEEGEGGAFRLCIKPTQSGEREREKLQEFVIRA